MSARLLLSFGVDEPPGTVEFHPSGRSLLVATSLAVEVRHAASGERMWAARFEHGAAGAVFAEGGASVVAAAGVPPGMPRASTVPGAERILVRLSEEEGRRRLDVAVSSILAATQDGAFALLDHGDGQLGLFDLRGLEARPPFVLGENASLWRTHSGSLSREGEIAVTSTRRGLPPSLVSTIEVWRTDGGRLRTGNASGNGPVAISPNGRYVLYGSGRQAILWQIEKGRIEPRSPMDSLAADVTCVAFASDGRRMLYGGGERVEVVGRRPAKESTTVLWPGRLSGSLLHPAGTDIRCARFSPDGRRVVTASAGGRVFVWDAS